VAGWRTTHYSKLWGEKEPKKLDQGERRPPDFHLKNFVPRLEPRLAQRTASPACSADQLHREVLAGEKEPSGRNTHEYSLVHGK
jgi:hypothetical protein